MAFMVPLVIGFVLGALVGGFLVYRNIDVVVEERYKKRRDKFKK